MATSIFGIGLTGLNAAQAGLATAGHNIANANTAGFHRQQVIQKSAPGQLSGGTFMGEGVQLDSVTRVYSGFLEAQVLESASQAAQLSTYAEQAKQVDTLLGSATAGLSPALQEFFTGLQDVAAHPASIPARQGFLSSAEVLAGRFQTLSGKLDELREGVNSRIGAAVDEVNANSRQLARLNQQILLTEGSTQQPANDLRDQRDALVTELNKLVGASVIKADDGSYNVYIGSGQSLVSGTRQTDLATLPGADPSTVGIGYVRAGGVTALNAASITGGTIGGLLAFRSQSLDAAQNGLGRVAIGLAQAVNDQHRLGQDLTNNLGADLFAVATPSVAAASGNGGGAVVAAGISDVAALTASDYRLAYSGGSYVVTRLSDNVSTSYGTLPQTVDGVTLSLASGTPADGDSFLVRPTRSGARDIRTLVADPAKLAIAAPIRAQAAAANTGTAAISAGTVSASPADPNLRQPVTLTFTGPGTFDVSGTGTGNPTGVAYTSGGAIRYNGWTVTVTGAPKAGDVFTVVPNSGGSDDNRNALALAAVQGRNLLAGGTTTLQSAYSSIVSQVGSTARAMQVSAEAQEALAADARVAQQSASGVNLDEEAANLIRFQQAYQASGKVIQIASKLFEELLSINR